MLFRPSFIMSVPSLISLNSRGVAWLLPRTVSPQLSQALGHEDYFFFFLSRIRQDQEITSTTMGRSSKMWIGRRGKLALRR